MLTEREKIAVGVSLLVILLVVVVTGVVLLAGRKGPSVESNYRRAVSSLPGQSSQALTPDQQVASSQQSQQQASDQTSGADSNSQSSSQSGTSTQSPSSPASSSSIAGQWTLEMQGASSAFPGLPVTLNPDGTITINGAESSYLKVKSSSYNYNTVTRAFKAAFTCNVSASIDTSMLVSFDFKGTMDAGLTSSSGTFTATINGATVDKGTFKLRR
jgi:cytoskeletal protein RodZ